MTTNTKKVQFTLELYKQYPLAKMETREGREAGVYVTDHGGDFPVFGWIKNKPGKPGKFIQRWKFNGSCLYSATEDKDDLFIHIPDEPRAGYEPWTLETAPIGRNIWVRNNESKGVVDICAWLEDRVILSILGHKSYESLFKCYTQHDGTPCGNKL